MTSHDSAVLKKAEKAKYMREYRPRAQVRAKRQSALVADTLAREEAAGIERAVHTSSKFDDDTGSKTKLKRATERQIIQSADPDLLQESHIAATEWITRKKKVHS